MLAPKRRPTTFVESSTPCQNCGFPYSQRHHLFQFATYGENEITVLLCPNCHRLYHLIGQAYRGNIQSQKLLNPFKLDQKLCDHYLTPLLRLYRDVERIEGDDVAAAAVEEFVEGRGRGPLAAEIDSEREAISELSDEWVKNPSWRPEGKEAIDAAIRQRMIGIRNRPNSMQA
jgi:hypothetical protein